MDFTTSTQVNCIVFSLFLLFFALLGHPERSSEGLLF